MMTRSIFVAAGLACVLVIGGCMSWQTEYPKVVPSGDPAMASAQLRKADQIAEQAGDRARLQGAIEAYEKVVEIDGDNFRALSELGHLYVLLGAAYAVNSDEKERYYKAAADYNARAMYTNKDFKALVDAGESLAEASRVLGKREMDAMGFWCQSLFYYYKECLGGVSRILNYKWILSARTVLDRMVEVDPEWKRGGLDFSLGIIYIALPEAAGGDKEKAREFVDGAVQKHPDVIRNRWGRAKYYYSVVEDRAGFRRDLEWVLGQNPRGRYVPYAWNVYFQSDAREMLDQIASTSSRP